MKAADESAGAPASAQRLERVVAGVDFSATSLAAVDWIVRHLASAENCLLVHALEVPREPAFLEALYPTSGTAVAEATGRARELFEEQRDRRAWGNVRIDVLEGRPEVVIADVAAQTGADVVAVGEHARPRSVWASLSSTAESLVRCSPVPVLLVRTPEDHPPRRILLALDESRHAAAALAWARILADKCDAHVTVCHVYRPVYLGVARAVSGISASRDLPDKQRQQTQQWLESRVESAGLDPARTTARVLQGDAASTLVALQRGEGFDFIVIGSRGAGGVGRMLLGSVANGVLRGASCPVLVVHSGS